MACGPKELTDLSIRHALHYFNKVPISVVSPAETMKRAIVLRARMNSTRLPGEILMDIAGNPMPTQQTRRPKRCRIADALVAASAEAVYSANIMERTYPHGLEIEACFTDVLFVSIAWRGIRGCGST